MICQRKTTHELQSCWENIVPGFLVQRPSDSINLAFHPCFFGIYRVIELKFIEILILRATVHLLLSCKGVIVKAPNLLPEVHGNTDTWHWSTEKQPIWEVWHHLYTTETQLVCTIQTHSTCVNCCSEQGSQTTRRHGALLESWSAEIPM